MDRITNESNLWLNALKMEDAGNYLEAFLFYLKDSAECIKHNSFVRAALSCSCAANCLTMTGNLAGARQLYMQAAIIYEDTVRTVIGDSVREALWLYQEAYEYYHLACENHRAQCVYEKYVSLSRKVDPFFGEQEAMESLRARKTTQESNSNINSTNMQVSADIDKAIKNFLAEIESDNDKPNMPIFQHVFKKISSKKGTASEKNITN